MMKAGGTATIYFDDLHYNGEAQDFTHDPGWIGAGNRTTFEDREQVGAHDFGYSAKTNIAGGAPGEVGGGLWRSGDYAYYADRVGPLGSEQQTRSPRQGASRHRRSRFRYSARLVQQRQQRAKVGDERNFVGVHVGGPTRIGHYFIPVFATAKGSQGKVEKGPVLVPGKTYDWSLVYDPAANHGNGELKTTLGDQSVTLALKPGQKADGANLDRFGLFTTTIGGQMVKIYFDDLEYTAGGVRSLSRILNDARRNKRWHAGRFRAKMTR